MKFLRLSDIDVKHKTVLVRTDVNVPMQGGEISDYARITRLLPTIQYLTEKKAKVLLISHFGRPDGKYDPSLSLAPVADALARKLGHEVKFSVDSVGQVARDAVAELKPGEVMLLENLRFHAEEEAGDVAFAKELAVLADVFVNDAFSASHRAHASIVGVPQFLPTAAGLLMAEEVGVLTSLFSDAEKPIGAVIGGSKISSKLALLGNLIKTMDVLAIGGAMANTFLYAQGVNVGKSICEKGMKDTALSVLAEAKKHGCKIVLPVDLVVAEKFGPQAPCRVVSIDKIPADFTAVDIGPVSTIHFADAMKDCKTLVWNGPVGAFETSPFDCSTVQLARLIAKQTRERGLCSIAGGGDTVAALTHAGLAEEFSYLSTAGGAFLEWLEGKELPGVAALAQTKYKLGASA
ncbi:MAG: phosphoglycerate kinase [Alphaproteobacteria bacterium]|nr:phosphoglycerate kinase [Alphaproteobacteria bacterium]